MKSLKKIAFALAFFMSFSQFSLAVFTDVSSDHPYYEAINYLREKGIIEGYDDGGYRPDQKVNRAEATKIALLGSDILVPEIQKQDIFSDVLYGSWYAKFVTKAKNLGVVSGDGTTSLFRPGDTVNLAEILKILIKINKITTKTPDKNPYPDVPADAWFAPYFDYAKSISLLPKEFNGNAYPNKEVTRGLMAHLMYGLAIKPEGYQEGKATYYGNSFNGKGTASGEAFNSSLFTAAHRTLPFGTWLQVRNLDNGKETYVRVNDRGPYGDENRIIDLSQVAFEAIANLSQGLANVSIMPVDGPPDNENKETLSSCPSFKSVAMIPSATFEGISLNTELPTTFMTDEVLMLQGSSSESTHQISAFLADESGKQQAFRTKNGSDGSFTIPLFFSKPGSYKLGVILGEAGSSVVKTITVLPQDCLKEEQNENLKTLSNLQLKVKNGDTIISWNNEENYNLIQLTFTQGNKKKAYLLRSLNEFIPRFSDFDGWSTGKVSLSIQGAHAESTVLADSKIIEWSPPLNRTFEADIHHQYLVNTEKVKPLSLPDQLKSGIPLMLTIDPLVNINTSGEIILPNGLVSAVAMTSTTPTLSGLLSQVIFPESSTQITLKFTPKTNELHFLEINDEEGLAAVNIPVFPEDVFPLIPNPVELSDLQPEPLSKDLNSLQQQMLELVNKDRTSHHLPTLTLDNKLNQLAQSRSDDMVKRGYFSHLNPDGLNANDLRRDFAIAPFVSENIARDVNVSLAEYGLMRSASHRSNILNKEWTRAGFGLTQDEDRGTIFVQIFSTDPIDISNVGNLQSEIVNELNALRATPLSLQSGLNSISQSWTDAWIKNPWCSAQDISKISCNLFAKPNGSTLVDTLHNEGVNESLKLIYFGNNSFEKAKHSILSYDDLKNSNWKNIGIGIRQDTFGIIHIFLIYTE